MKRSSVFPWLMQRSMVIAVAALLVAPSHHAGAQGITRWLKAGSLHNWYSQYGCEIEIGNDPDAQQFGLRWPSLYNYQDMQAAKALWLGVTNFTDDKGNATFSYKVVHVGPRVTGTGEFFPVSFDMYSKYPPTDVIVDGLASVDEVPKLKAIDPNLPCDRMIVNVVNTAIGVTMTRTIYAFGQQFHDNYHIAEYVFKNTGNTNADEAIELPNQTLTGFYAYFTYRYSVCRQIGYMVNLHATWGYNAMNDTRGVPGVDPPTVDPLTGSQDLLRCQFTWHGKDASAKSQTTAWGWYDNTGAPICAEGPSLAEKGFISSDDTVGRLGGAQFVGNCTVFASKGPGALAATDDPTQPSTTSQEGSDDIYTSKNDAMNRTMMTGEYTEWITRGHRSPRHAWRVIPSGDFAMPTNDPSYADPQLSTPGGFSVANGYGPYTLGPGDSIVIVIAEGANGLTHDECVRIGRNYKDGVYDARTKNDSVVTTGRNRLFETFRRAIANYKSGYTLSQPPPPPRSLTVTSRGDRIILNWQPPTAFTPAVSGYNVYRATGRRDSTYHLVYQAGASETSYEDTSLIRGVGYYYYVSSVGSTVPMSQVVRPNATGSVALESNQYFTQTYNAAFLKRKPGTAMDSIRIVPNPYIASANSSTLRFVGEPDKIAFFDIPRRCNIKIFTELGELIYEINPAEGTGDAYWNSVTSSGQVVVSGIYLVVFEDLETGARIIKKLIVVR